MHPQSGSHKIVADLKKKKKTYWRRVQTVLTLFVQYSIYYRSTWFCFYSCQRYILVQMTRAMFITEITHYLMETLISR